MKKTILIALTILINLSLFAQSSYTNVRTIEQDITFSGKEIIIDINCDVEMVTWKGNKVKVLIEIEFNNHKTGLIKELAKMNRYEMEVTETSHLTIISMPNLKEIVKINDIYLDESVRFKVLVPENLRPHICEDGNLAVDYAAL